MKTRKRKINKKGKTKKRVIQSAGIRIKNNFTTPDEAFKYFIENSTFSYFNSGFCGILILAKLKDELKSPYRHIRTNRIDDVKYILLKFFEIKTSTDIDVKNIDSSDIQREIDIQQIIYHSSLINPNTILEPICPCIVYSHSEALDQNYKDSFYQIINQSIKNNNLIDNLFQGDVAFFAMEFMENYSPLSNYINGYHHSSAIRKALYTLDKLHALEFMHNDFHDDNVLLLKDSCYFGLDKEYNNGRAIIIDFGLTTEIELPEKIDNNYRLRLLQKESYYAHPGLFYLFNIFDEKCKIIQDKYIKTLEKYYKCDIIKIINSYRFYKGGNMSTPKSKFEQRIHKRNYYYNTSNKENKSNKENSNEDKSNEDKNRDKIVADYEEEFKRVNPEKYKELMDNIKESLEEETKYPGYIDALFRNQMDCLIDPTFTLPEDNDPNKLRLIMS